ncbi:MAG: hypothetical protein ACFFFH_16305 [Candidatus Thorarchaeota archaeon]
MTTSHSTKRILVVGREVGPIVQLIKEKKPEISIGAVDILGNQETRLYTDWKFSIEKQSPDTLIQRSKHRSIVDLLFELTLVMLEELEFDLLIPLSPLQTKPKYIDELSRELEIFAPSYKILEQATSAFVFLTNISLSIPELMPSSLFTSDLSNVMTYPAIFVSPNGLSHIPSEESIISLESSNLSGFLLPISQIHCTFFFSMSHDTRFFGLQTLSDPHEHAFFPNNLEKNGIIPFSTSNFTHKRIISYLSRLIIKLGIVGMGTIYFGLSKDSIFPVSCNVLPDENLAFWEKKTSSSLVPFLLNEKSNHIPQFNTPVSAFKIPIYSYRSIRVPPLSGSLCTQRNLPGVISHPEYPLCAVSAKSSSFSSAHKILKQKKKEILKVLHPEDKLY